MKILVCGIFLLFSIIITLAHDGKFVPEYKYDGEVLGTTTMERSKRQLGAALLFLGGVAAGGIAGPVIYNKLRRGHRHFVSDGWSEDNSGWHHQSNGWQRPVNNGWQTPDNSGWQQPAVSGWSQPASSGWQKPVNTGWQQPASSGWQKPVSTGWQQQTSSWSGWQKPVSTGWEKPATIVFVEESSSKGWKR